MQALEAFNSEQKDQNPGSEPANHSFRIPEVFTRFTKIHILEHWLVMCIFTILVITGLPQKFSESIWAAWIVQMLGGIDMARLLHRISGLLFAALAVWHLGRVLILLVLRKIGPSMIPTGKDFRDAVVTMRYYVGLSEERALFDRYDFRQKFEYLGLLMGSMVMIGTGFVLMFPILVTVFLPGVVIPAAKIAHSYESLLAFLVIVIWHMYGAHFSPEVFPGDTSIFTGRVSRERMEHEHTLEYERIVSTLQSEAEQQKLIASVNKDDGGSVH